jgi:hypothetical protein
MVCTCSRPLSLEKGAGRDERYRRIPQREAESAHQIRLPPSYRSNISRSGQSTQDAYTCPDGVCVGTISVNVLLQYLFRFFLFFFPPFFLMYSCYSGSLWCSRHFFLNISQQILGYSMFSSLPSLVSPFVYGIYLTIFVVIRHCV